MRDLIERKRERERERERERGERVRRETTSCEPFAREVDLGVGQGGGHGYLIGKGGREMQQRLGAVRLPPPSQVPVNIKRGLLEPLKKNQ
jgi:hypothetical protein